MDTGNRLLIDSCSFVKMYFFEPNKRIEFLVMVNNE